MIGELRVSLAESMTDVLSITHDHAVVGVDIPLALPPSGLRPSDQALKSFLGRSGRSLFWTPTRPAINAAHHADAVTINKAHGGKGPSAQGWGLAAKIREARAACRSADLDGGPRVLEVHPESSFTMMNLGQPLPSKKTAGGVGQRIALLESRFGSLTPALASVGDGPVIDDVLDAIAAAWTARRVLDGEAEWFGGAESDAPDDEGFVLPVPV